MSRPATRVKLARDGPRDTKAHDTSTISACAPLAQALRAVATTISKKGENDHEHHTSRSSWQLSGEEEPRPCDIRRGQ
jgi:hypothetical protein